MIYHLMMLLWELDDAFPFWTPFSWLGDRVEDIGLRLGVIQFSEREACEGCDRKLSSDLMLPCVDGVYLCPPCGYAELSGTISELRNALAFYRTDEHIGETEEGDLFEIHDDDNKPFGFTASQVLADAEEDS